MVSPSVLIAGAGPTGLVLALSLARRGVDVRLIDQAKGPCEHSRAMVVQARTLEFYRQFGFGDETVERGVRVKGLHFREARADGGAAHALDVEFGAIGEGLSPYPFALAFPQDDHERFLLEKLSAAGIQVERDVGLESFDQDADHVRATLRHGDGRSEQTQALYICGCDGARSAVRHSLNLNFPGGEYRQLYFVADVGIAGGFDRDLHVTLGKDLLALMLPVRSRGMQRLIGLVPPDLGDKDDVAFDSFKGRLERLLDIKIAEVNWFSTYRVHHRVAEKFQVGRAFLLGDAGHIHSPAGGQGMNTGIGDAINLGWKLAQCVQGRANADLLATYETERIVFARTLVATTDRAFKAIVAGGLAGEAVRRFLAPMIIRFATGLAIGRRLLFSTISQTRIHYPDSRLSEGKAGGVRGGDRLPYVRTPSGEDNFAPLRTLDWQGHVYGRPTPALVESCRRQGLPLHAFDLTREAQAAGFAANALYLVRPDGYVAFAANEDEAASALDRYAGRNSLRLGPQP